MVSWDVEITLWNNGNGDKTVSMCCNVPMESTLTSSIVSLRGKRICSFPISTVCPMARVSSRDTISLAICWTGAV